MRCVCYMKVDEKEDVRRRAATARAHGAVVGWVEVRLAA